MMFKRLTTYRIKSWPILTNTAHNNSYIVNIRRPRTVYFSVFSRRMATSNTVGNNINNFVQTLRDSAPFTTEDEAKEIIKVKYNLNVVDIKKLSSYDDLNFYVKTEENTSDKHNEFVLKINNKQLSLDEGLFEAYNDLMLRLKASDISAPIPIMNVDKKYYSLEHLTKTENNVVVREGDYMVRLLTYIPGKMLVEIKQPPLQLFYDAGRILAQVHNAWKGYEHPSLIREDFDWNLRAAPKTHAFAHLPSEQWQRNLSTTILDKFEKEVLPHYDKLSKGVIHGDFNELNIIVAESGDNPNNFTIAGILDFGDSIFSRYIFDVGISLAYMMLTDVEESATAAVCNRFLSGYESVLKLPDSEVNMIITIMCTRLVQSLLFGLHYYSIDPSDTYVLSTQKRGWNALKNVWKLSIEDVKNNK